MSDTNTQTKRPVTGRGKAKVAKAADDAAKVQAKAEAKAKAQADKAAKAAADKAAKAEARAEAKQAKQAADKIKAEAAKQAKAEAKAAKQAKVAADKAEADKAKVAKAAAKVEAREQAQATHVKQVQTATAFFNELDAEAYSIPVKPSKGFAAQPARPHTARRNSSPRQAAAIAVALRGNGVKLVDGTTFCRTFTIDSFSYVIENGCTFDCIASGLLEVDTSEVHAAGSEVLRLCAGASKTIRSHLGDAKLEAILA